MLNQNVGWMRRVSNLIVFIFTSMFFLFSAGICENMKSIKIWLAKKKNRKMVKQKHEMFLILNELGDHNVSVKIGGVFPITHGVYVQVIEIF